MAVCPSSPGPLACSCPVAHSRRCLSRGSTGGRQFPSAAFRGSSGTLMFREGLAAACARSSRGRAERGSCSWLGAQRLSHASEQQGLTKAGRGGSGTDGDNFIFPALVSHVDPLPGPPASGDGQEAGGLHVNSVLVASADGRAATAPGSRNRRDSESKAGQALHFGTQEISERVTASCTNRTLKATQQKIA